MIFNFINLLLLNLWHGKIFICEQIILALECAFQKEINWLMSGVNYLVMMPVWILFRNSLSFVAIVIFLVRSWLGSRVIYWSRYSLNFIIFRWSWFYLISYQVWFTICILWHKISGSFMFIFGFCFVWFSSVWLYLHCWCRFRSFWCIFMFMLVTFMFWSDCRRGGGGRGWLKVIDIFIINRYLKPIAEMKIGFWKNPSL